MVLLKDEVFPKVVLVSGHAGNGKDTVAGIIRDTLKANGERVLITHYADLVKYMCKAFFQWDGCKDEKGRSLLQYVGTDCVRKIKPDYWVTFIVDVLRFFPNEWDWVIIPDTRFPNEIDVVKEAGFDVTHVRVVRPFYENGLSPEQLSHPSETALDGVAPDVFITNDGDMRRLVETVSNWVQEELYE